ncbi:MAG: DnaJ domain-containing protein [Nitrospinaceae bacterium]
MSWLLGAGMGFLRGGPFGALVGGTLQHFLTKKALKRIQNRLPGITQKGLFVTCLVVVQTKVALAKGPLTHREVQVLHRFFIKNLGYGSEDLKFVDKIIDETQRLNPDIGPFVQQYQKATQNNYNLLLLALSYQITLMGDSLTRETQERINQVARLLGISYEQHDRIRGKYSLGALKTPYTILGIKPSSSNEEIKKAYRRKVGQYHPDRVAHLGEDQGEEAHLKFLEIQAAYEELERIRGV